jgi:hypothetical protein
MPTRCSRAVADDIAARFRSSWRASSARLSPRSDRTLVSLAPDFRSLFAVFAIAFRIE